MTVESNDILNIFLVLLAFFRTGLMTSFLAHFASFVVFAIARIVTVFQAVFTFNFLFSFVLTIMAILAQ